MLQNHNQNNSAKLLWRWLMVVLLCLTNVGATASIPDNQGYLYLHPLFKSRPWQATMDKVFLTKPDELDALNPVSFDVANGRDSAMAVFSVANNDCFVMASYYQKLISPCYNFELTYNAPQKIAFGSFTQPLSKKFYLIKDSSFSFTTIKVVLLPAVASLKMYVATINTNTLSITRVDSITLAQRKAGQKIQTVDGIADSITGQDLGLWVTGDQGLIRYIPYGNHILGTPAVRDLGANDMVLHANGTFAGTMSGKIFRRSGVDTFFVQESISASGPIRRVYNRGAIGDNGLFVENWANLWRSPATLGEGDYRYANFIRRPGGFGVELLDSAWNYRVYTYRDSTTLIASTVPASLITNVTNGSVFEYTGSAPLSITVNLRDPDSTYNDYGLWMVRGGGQQFDLKSDGKYSISALADSPSCHIGSLKMTSGSVRITLARTAVTVAHDCALGTSNPTCNSCTWKKYDFTTTQNWQLGDVLRIETGSQILRIRNGNGQVTAVSGPRLSSQSQFAIRGLGNSRVLHLNIKNGIIPRHITIYNLNGQCLASVPVTDNHFVTLPAIAPTTMLLFSCRMSDGSVVQRRVPFVK